MQEALRIYHDTNRKLKGLGLALFLHEWDSSTEAPKDAMAYRATQLGALSEMMYRLATDPAYEASIDKLFEHRNELDEVLSHEIAKAKKELVKTKQIPMEEFVAFNELMTTIYPVYVEAKQTSNYPLYEPELKKVIEFKKKVLLWQKSPERQGYDIFLDDFEPGFSKAEYDVFFGALKEKLVPFAKAVAKKKLKYNRSFLKQKFPVDKQKEFAEYLRDVFGFDRNKTVIKESEHPFTTNNGTSDVRITTHYHEDDPVSAIFSTIHEMGHGLYELQVDPALDQTMSGGGASMAMHESQSRMMENMIGRSRAFWETHYPKLQSLFPKQLAKTTVDDWVKHVNRVAKSFIRTEADELTYSLHIMIRYELEKAIFSGKQNPDLLPDAWNKLYKKYLGIVVTNDKEGILQDVHWSGGSFGYFPTYALGTAYAAQLYRAMERDLNVEAVIRQGSLQPITAWLKEHVHRYGASKDPKEILKLATQEDFNPQYFVDYLIAKYTALYELA